MGDAMGSSKADRNEESSLQLFSDPLDGSGEQSILKSFDLKRLSYCGR